MSTWTQGRVLFFLASLVIAIVFILTARRFYSNRKTEHVVFMPMFYHKSGTVFSFRILQKIVKKCSLPSFRDGQGNASSCNSLSYFQKIRKEILTEHDLVGFRAFSVAEEWQKVFAAPGRQIRIVHMLRDPFELILSAYKYHSQEPAPESWLEQSSGQVCRPHRPLSFFTPLFRCLSPSFSADELKRLFQAIDTQCAVAQSVFPNDLSYHHALLLARHFFQPPSQLQQEKNRLNATRLNQTALIHYTKLLSKGNNLIHHVSAKSPLDVFPAIYLEALRSLRQIENMAINKLYEAPGLSLSMSVEEFGVGNLTQFRSAAKKMASFVLLGHTREKTYE